jgi:hypothetical protein
MSIYPSDRAAWDDLFMARCAIAAYEDDLDVIKKFITIEDSPIGPWKPELIKAVRLNNQFCFITWAEVSGTVEIVLAFRGTDDFSTDWYRNNLRVSKITPTWASENDLKGKVHEGFSAAWDDLQENAMGIINYVISTYHGREIKLFCTGHSLGGALAQLAITDRFDFVGEKYLITFASPLVGDADWQHNYSAKSIKGAVYEARDEILGIISPDKIVALNSVLNTVFGYEYSPFSFTIDRLHGLFSIHHSMSTYVDYFTRFYEDKSKVSVESASENLNRPQGKQIGFTDTQKPELKRAKSLSSVDTDNTIILEPGDELNTLRITSTYFQASTDATIYLEGYWAGRDDPKCLTSFTLKAGTGSINEFWSGSEIAESAKIGLLRFVRIRAELDDPAGSITFGSILIYLNNVPVTNLNSNGMVDQLGLNGFSLSLDLILNSPQYQISGITTSPEGVDAIQIFKGIGTYRDGRDQSTDYYANVDVVRYPSKKMVYGALEFGFATNTGKDEKNYSKYNWSCNGESYWSDRGKSIVQGRVYATGFGEDATGRLYGKKMSSHDMFFSNQIIIGVSFLRKTNNSKKIIDELNYGVTDGVGLDTTTVAQFYNHSKTEYQSFVIHSLRSH